MSEREGFWGNFAKIFIPRAGGRLSVYLPSEARIPAAIAADAAEVYQITRQINNRAGNGQNDPKNRNRSTPRSNISSQSEADALYFDENDSDHVAALQEELETLGYKTGERTDVMTRELREAFKKFEKDYKKYGTNDDGNITTIEVSFLSELASEKRERRKKAGNDRAASPSTETGDQRSAASSSNNDQGVIRPAILRESLPAGGSVSSELRKALDEFAESKKAFDAAQKMNKDLREQLDKIRKDTEAANEELKKLNAEPDQRASNRFPATDATLEGVSSQPFNGNNGVPFRIQDGNNLSG